MLDIYLNERTRNLPAKEQLDDLVICETVADEAYTAQHLNTKNKAGIRIQATNPPGL